ELPVASIEELCRELAADYETDGRGFMLVKVAGGYRYQTHPDLAPYVERFVLEGQHARLSAPAFETLAIIAYKQPISRAQISAIRGVDVESVLSTLLRRGYIEEVGRDPGPGQTVMYGTTREFLVGRLDYDTEGLLVLTNDGDLAQLVTHPRHGIEKTYLAEVSGVPSRATIRALREGVTLEDGRSAPARVRLVQDLGVNAAL